MKFPLVMLAFAVTGLCQASLIPLAATLPILDQPERENELAKLEKEFERLMIGREYTKARPVIEKFLGQIPSGDSDRRLIGLNALSEIHLALNDLAAASRYANQALAMARRLFVADNTLAANALNQVGRILVMSGQAKAGLEHLEQSLAIREHLLQDHRETAISLNNVAQCYAMLGSIDKALQYSERALRMCERLYPNDHPQLAAALNGYALALNNVGRTEEALELAQDSLAMRGRLYRHDHPDLIASLMSVGICMASRGRHNEAQKSFSQSIEMSRRFYGRHHPDLASSLDNAGISLRNLGRPDEALVLHEQALNMRRILFGDLHPHLASSMNNIGQCLRGLGRDGDAQYYFRQSLALWERLFRGKDHPEVAGSLGNIGSCLTTLASGDQARNFLEQSLAMRERLFSGSHPSTAGALNDLGVLCNAIGRGEEALGYYRRSLNMYEEIFPMGHPIVASVVRNIGLCLDELGRADEGLAYLRRSLEMSGDLRSEDDPEFAESVKNLAICLSNMGRPEEADEYWTQWLRLQVARIRHRSFLADTGLVDREFQEHTSTVANLPTRKMETEYLSLTGLRHLLTRTGQIRRLDGLVEEDPNLTELRGRSEESAEKFQDLIMSPPQDRTSDGIRGLHSKAKLDADAAYARYANAVREKFGEKLQIDPPSMQQVQAKLGSDGAVVDFYQRTDREKPYYLAVVTLGAGKSHFIEVGSEAAIEAAVRELQELMNGSEGLGNAEAIFAKLDELTFRPLDKILKGKTRVYVVADGVIAQIPLAGLVTGVKPDKNSETGKRTAYRIEEMALRLVPSPLEPGLRPSGASGEGSVIVADIDPNLDPSAAKVKPNRAQFATTSKPGETRGDGLDENGNWKILPYAEEEIKKLKATETLRYAQVWRKDMATEEQLLKLKSPRYLIISAHGFFTEKDDKRGDFKRSAIMSQLAKADDSMFRSGLVLSGANHADELRKNGKYDGLLTAADAARLNLRGTRLVVLSACQSGRGDFSAGMGVLGLRRAFRTAGAQGVVMSLFNVPNQSTAELMALFFKHVKEGSDNAEALRKAQLEMMKKMGPFHWAGFVYEGS